MYYIYKIQRDLGFVYINVRLSREPHSSNLSSEFLRLSYCFNYLTLSLLAEYIISLICLLSIRFLETVSSPYKYHEQISKV